MNSKSVSPPPHEYIVDGLANSWDKHMRGWLSLADINQHFHGTASKVRQTICDWDLVARNCLGGNGAV